MSIPDLLNDVRERLRVEGEPWELHFEVMDVTYREGNWLHVYVLSDSHRRNSAAERQIRRNVESDVKDELGEEILLVRITAHDQVAERERVA